MFAFFCYDNKSISKWLLSSFQPVSLIRVIVFRHIRWKIKATTIARNFLLPMLSFHKLICSYSNACYLRTVLHLIILLVILTLIVIYIKLWLVDSTVYSVQTIFFGLFCSWNLLLAHSQDLHDRLGGKVFLFVIKCILEPTNSLTKLRIFNAIQISLNWDNATYIVRSGPALGDTIQCFWN